MTDQGDGIASADQPHVFERYWRANSDGDGIGLSIVRQIALAHGGVAAVRSPSVGTRGATFSFSVTR